MRDTPVRPAFDQSTTVASCANPKQEQYCMPAERLLINGKATSLSMCSMHEERTRGRSLAIFGMWLRNGAYLHLQYLTRRVHVYTLTAVSHESSYCVLYSELNRLWKSGYRSSY